MKHQKIVNLLNEANNFKFVRRKWNDKSKTNYNTANEVTYHTEVLKSSLCDYNDVYMLLRGDITVTAGPAAEAIFKKLHTVY